MADEQHRPDGGRPDRPDTPGETQDHPEVSENVENGQNEEGYGTFETYDEQAEYVESDLTDEQADPLEALQSENLSRVGSGGGPGDVSGAAFGGPISGAAGAQAKPAAKRTTPAHQFKEFFVPLLVFAAVALVGVGALVLLTYPPAVEDSSAVAAANHGYDVHPTTPGRSNLPRYLAIAAFPMAAVMLAGAWLFWRDVQSAKKGR